jgi:integrase
VRDSRARFASGEGVPCLDTAIRASAVKRLTWHQLRHVSASVLIEQGASVAYLARILGHANPSITMAVYAHEFAAREHGDAMRERMEAAFGEVLTLR